MDMQTMWLRHNEALVRYLRRMTRSQAEAEDLAQLTFLRALEHVGEVTALSDAHAKAWLYKTAYRAFIDARRRQSRQTPLLEETLPAYEEDFTGLHAEQWMDRLPPGHAQVVRMRHLQGYTSAQIGRALDIPPATVRTRLRAAMTLLRKYEEQEASI